MPASLIGEMDTLVTLQSCVMTRGSQGQKQFSFADYRDVWARVERNVDEQVGDGNLEAGHTATLLIYKVPALDTRWRVVLEGKPWGITAIDPISRLSPVCNLTIQSIDG